MIKSQLETILFAEQFDQMKKTFKMMALLALGASAVFLNGCKDVEDPIDPIDPVDPVVTCKMNTSSNDGEVTTYMYNTSDQVISSETGGETTTYEYDTEGKMTTATAGTTVSTCTYSGGFFPSRVDVTDNGVNDGYYIMEEDANGITKIEEHDDEGEISAVTYATYDTDGNVTRIQIDTWEPNTMEFITIADIQNIVTDTMNNPFYGNFALIFANIDGLTVYGKTNFLSGDFEVFGQSLPATATHTYNDHDLPLTTTFNAAGETTDFIYTYTCD